MGFTEGIDLKGECERYGGVGVLRFSRGGPGRGSINGGSFGLLSH